ncbi:hypothetical protein, partial [Streptomyces noursei]|uniref:hypothetical protein n=1 Tax=Streptomyces noursei TaxID=1971 RepID=UPI0035DB8920
SVRSALMSTARRPLGHGPQPQAPAVPAPAAGPARRVRATEADVETEPLYRGGLQGLQQLRERGVLGTPYPAPGPA